MSVNPNKPKKNKKNRDPYAGYDVSTEEGRQGYRNYYNARADFEAEMNRARWERALQDPAYKAYAEREAAAAGFSLKQLKQQWDINEANNKSSRNIANANNETSLKIARMNAANQQQQTALQAAQVAADLSSRPDDYWKANAFYNGVAATEIPNWLTGLVQGMPNVAWSPPAVSPTGQIPAMVAQSPTTPNVAADGSVVAAPAVSGDTSGGSTGTGTAAPIAGQNGAQTVASTAPVNGTPVATVTPPSNALNSTPQANSIQFQNRLMNGQAQLSGVPSLPWINQAANAPHKIAPGTIESMDPTRRAMFLAGVNATGHDAPSFLNSYSAYAINQGDNARAY